MKTVFAICIFAGAIAMRGAESFQDWKKVEEERSRWNRLSELEIKARAEAGDPVAKYFYHEKLLELHQTGNKEKFALSTKFLKEASEAGVPQAIFERARQLRESKEFIPVLEAAAKTGFPPAEVDLAYELLEGTRAGVDEGRAVELMQTAADAGNANAEFELGEMYACGQGEPRNAEEKPLQLYLRAARKGNSEAMGELAWRYREGYGTEKDLLEAARWTWRTAQYGGRITKDASRYMATPENLADPDRKLFNEFYEMYATANTTRDAAMMLKVGKAFARGELGKKNFKTAYVWLSMAAKAGAADATLVAEVKKSLSPEEVSEIDLEVARMEAEEAAAAQARGKKQ